MAISGIGVMSGSSIDGLDMAFCTFEENHHDISCTLGEARTLPFPEELAAALRSADGMTGRQLMELDAQFGTFTGQQVKAWMEAHALRPHFIASHGHTVFHEPSAGYTTQIGSGAHIAYETGVDTITMFRQADIAAGGQGAPFAPAIDRILFHGYTGYLNLGGIANVHIETTDSGWKAWDVCPCNQALNFLAAQNGLPFDEDGRLAAAGKADESVVSVLMEKFPLANGSPGSLSNRDVHDLWISGLSLSLSRNNLPASVTEAIARLIIDHISPLIRKPATILVTGGGTHNTWLLSRLNALGHTFHIRFEAPSKQVIDFKESLLIAYLGWRTLQGKPFSIHHSTGALKDTIGGAIFRAVT